MTLYSVQNFYASYLTYDVNVCMISVYVYAVDLITCVGDYS